MMTSVMSPASIMPDHVARSVADAAHGAARDAGLLDDVSSTRGRHEREARLVELVGADDGLGLVALAHRDEHGAAFGEPGACGELASEERLAEVTAHAHHFARRAHFRPEDRVDAEELGERENGLLDAHVARRHLEVHALFGERLARHYACGDGGDGVARGLGDERHRAGGARIHFKDVDDGVFECACWTANCTFMRPTTLSASAMSFVWRLISSTTTAGRL